MKTRDASSWHPIAYGSFVLLTIVAIGATAGTVIILKNKEAAYHEAETVRQHQAETADVALPFPVGVDPQTQTITEDPQVESYLTSYLAYDAVKPVRNSWWHQLTRALTKKTWYQNLASPVSRILVIWPGDRKEEVVDNFGDILDWDNAARTEFSTLITTGVPPLPDGTFFPGRYVVTKDATPSMVATEVQNRFAEEVLARYPESVNAVVPLTDALTIASLLEREAYRFDQMREISGVLWNRLFTDMPLQLDASLQYVKASQTNTPSWWPGITPDDKYLSSPYNTYEHAGLPPAPIANPSAAAILAALNPTNTNCFFYFHDENGTMYCSATYEEHVEKLRALYGRGS